jgi:hypothetical protein
MESEKDALKDMYFAMIFFVFLPMIFFLAIIWLLLVFIFHKDIIDEVEYGLSRRTEEGELWYLTA